MEGIEEGLSHYLHTVMFYFNVIPLETPGALNTVSKWVGCLDDILASIDIDID